MLWPLLVPIRLKHDLERRAEHWLLSLDVMVTLLLEHCLVKVIFHPLLAIEGTVTLTSRQY